MLLSRTRAYPASWRAMRNEKWSKLMSEFQITFKEPTPNRVLIADDDPVMTHLLTTILKQQQCESVIANDGREAYRILQADSRFRAAILDMSMPFLEGLDLIHYMRSERRLMRIPIM